MPQKIIDLKDAERIHPGERDFALNLHGPRMIRPPSGRGWNVRGSTPLRSRSGSAYPWRVVSWSKPTDLRQPDFHTFEWLKVRRLQFIETIVPFPSAPIYHTHRKQQHQFTLRQRVNYHTLRLLRPVNAKPAKRIYLLHNGLNELDRLSFHYKVAAILMHRDQEAACILRPFPGHLTRHPFGEPYAERPLDRYLLDPGDLFRQFLRFMLESQWLLTVLVPHVDYRVVAGLDLLAVGKRHEDPAVAHGIYDSWKRAYGSHHRGSGETIKYPDLERIVTAIRDLLKCRPHAQNPDVVPEKEVLEPSLHTVGYSLGGFLAQAIFFTWPFAVASSVTICSGGALRDIALTAFAHSEEWQTVVHSLLYEIDSSMIEGRIRLTRGVLAGCDPSVFSCFYRIFYDVVVRQFGGSYRSRVSEFVTRLFFILGGRDPIVSTQTVLDASPPGGINMVQVANLPHFPEKGDVEWQGFWLPETTNLLRRFASRSELLLSKTHAGNWWNAERTDHVPAPSVRGEAMRLLARRPGARSEFDPETGDEALPSEAFQLALHDMAESLVERDSATGRIVKKKGWLMIARNEVPAALLGKRILRRRGGTLHHSEELIWANFDGLRAREELLLTCQDRVTLVVPSRWRTWFVRPQPIFSPKHEAAMFRIPSPRDLKLIQRDFMGGWSRTGALRFFNPKKREVSGLPPLNTLPDVYVYLSEDLVRLVAGELLTRKNFEQRLAAFIESGFACNSAKAAQERFEAWLRSGELRMVRVSVSEFNPRFRGWRIRNGKRARAFLNHASLAWRYSRLG